MRKPINREFPHMLVGYMRVSTEGDRQVMNLQRDAFLVAEVDERHLSEDRTSGSRYDRASLSSWAIASWCGNWTVSGDRGSTCSRQ